jgi:hypothetical protein
MVVGATAEERGNHIRRSWPTRLCVWARTTTFSFFVGVRISVGKHGVVDTDGHVNVGRIGRAMTNIFSYMTRVRSAPPARCT